MNVLLIAQCDKRALVQTRRILDQFAERRGDRTWQTPITQAGLDTLRRLLRKTARRNTAVACHWIRGRDHSQLLWIVGDASRFNSEGAVPTDTTVREVLRAREENDWHTAEDIGLLAQLAGLLHDLGKASQAFQERLRGRRSEGNLYRHEWVSLRMFQAFVGDAGDDAQWLRRLAAPSEQDLRCWTAPGRYLRDGLDPGDAHPFRQLPPLAAAVGWLVLTHHRLPVVPAEDGRGRQASWGTRARRFDPAWLDQPLAAVAHDWNEQRSEAGPAQAAPYWTPAGALPVVEPLWRQRAARLALRLSALSEQRPGGWLDNPYVMHLARLSLMLADHHYSSLDRDSPQRVQGQGRTALYANTDREGALKQPLDEHLLGVADHAGRVAHALPGFERQLPRLVRHRGLNKRSAEPRYAWQDKAADAAAALRQAARERGAFIVNMASTGCGKTLANARLLNALADPAEGLRASYALGLRTLTLQTGRSYRRDLRLREDELAVRVGGSGSRLLFEHHQRRAEAAGSGSAQALIEEDGHVVYEGDTAAHPLLSRALRDGDIRRLLAAPLLVCTVDHLAPATESLRAGRQIAPMLRLMSSDLVLDELDDYGLEDLPALTRLVHWAGLLGTRVVLSSATLPPALVEGMFLAYRAGRAHYARNRGPRGGTAAREGLPCLWTDEFGTRTAQCGDGAAFAREHAAFVDQRIARLRTVEPLRRGELLELRIEQTEPAKVHAAFARELREACLRLHGDHAETDPFSAKRVSFGLVRMANIGPLFEVAQALYALDAPPDTRIHLCVYHARFPQVQRSAIEAQLDQAFDRRGEEGRAVYRVPGVRAALDAHPEANHVFVVLASPVCEVGRDWDADWAVTEPSSMRSLIQLAGRVRRHRGPRDAQPGTAPSARPNVLIFDTNLRKFRGERGSDGQPGPIFLRPGFESAGGRVDDPFRLQAHRLGKLLDLDEYAALTAVPRIRPRPAEALQPKRRLADLEHARLADCMLPRERPPRRGDDLNAASAWQHPQALLTGMLPQQQRFRAGGRPSTTLVFLPDEDGDALRLHRIDDSSRGNEGRVYAPIERGLRRDVSVPVGAGLAPWGRFDLLELLTTAAEDLDLSLRDCAERLATVEVLDSEQGWRYHPWLGFTH